MTNKYYSSKATIAHVTVGFVEIEGLMLSDGSHAVSVPQIAELLGIPCKTILGMKPQFLKVWTEADSEPVRVLSVPEFEQLSEMLATFGNEYARLLVGNPQKKKAPSRRLERKILTRLQDLMGGTTKVRTLGGVIDLITYDQIVKVKHIHKWKSALGQILVYGKYCPYHQKRIHLYGETQESYLELIRSHCETYDVVVTHQTR